MPTKLQLLLINTNKGWGGGEVWFFTTALALRTRGYGLAAVIRRDSPLEMRCKENNIPCFSVIHPALYALFNYRKIKKFFSSNHPDLAIANAGVDVIYAQIIKYFTGNFKLIFRRGLDKRLKNSLLNRQLYQRVDYFLANSLATAKTLQTSFPWLSDEKIYTLYNPVDFNPHAAADGKTPIDLNIPDQQTHVLGIVARLTEQKGHRILFKALKQVVRTHNNLILVIIGKGELEQTLKKECQRLGIESYCRFIGHQDRIAPYYRRCDIIIIPSLFEGFCYVAVEAQYHEKPVIASDTSSLNEVIQDGQTGLLFEPGNSTALAEKIVYLLTVPEKRIIMGKKGREFVENNFASELIYNKLEKLLTEWK